MAPRAEFATENTHHETYKRAKKPLNEDKIRNFFKAHDANNDKHLSRDELKKAFQTLGALFPSFRACRGLAKADANGDGKVSKNEMDALVQYALSLGYTVK